MTYIISTNKGFKLLKELPKEPDYGITKYEFRKKVMWEEYQRAIAQAIDSAPFIKNDWVINSLFPKLIGFKKDYPYQVDLSGYNVSEPFNEIANPLDSFHTKFVTLTPKAVENKSSINDYEYCEEFN